MKLKLPQGIHFSRRTTVTLVALVSTILGWTWFVVKRVLEFIGASSLLQDAANAESVSRSMIVWCLNQPWWFSAIFAVLWSAVLIYLTFDSQEKAIQARAYMDKSEETERLFLAARRSISIRSDKHQAEELYKEIIEFGQRSRRIRTGETEINHHEFEHEARTYIQKIESLMKRLNVTKLRMPGFGVWPDIISDDDLNHVKDAIGTYNEKIFAARMFLVYTQCLHQVGEVVRFYSSEINRLERGDF